IGTAKGLGFFQNGNVGKLKTPPAALKEPVLGLAEDNKGWLWVATSNRVLRVNRNTLVRGTMADTDLREFGLADGLRAVESVKRHRSVVSDLLGRIWFSMNRGLSVVDPQRLELSVSALPRVQLISADGTEFDLKSRVRIPPRPQRIAVR